MRTVNSDVMCCRSENGARLTVGRSPQLHLRHLQFIFVRFNERRAICIVCVVGEWISFEYHQQPIEINWYSEGRKMSIETESVAMQVDLVSENLDLILNDAASTRSERNLVLCLYGVVQTYWEFSNDFAYKQYNFSRCFSSMKMISRTRKRFCEMPIR